MRMPIRVREVGAEEIIKNQKYSPDSNIIPGSIFYKNAIQGIWLFYDV